MWNCIGKALNLDVPIIGRVSKKSALFFGDRDTIYVAKGANKSGLRSAALITTLNLKDVVAKTPIVAGLKEEDVDDLFEGDILSISPSGLINRVWDIKSKHNALFVTGDCNSRCIMCPQPIKKDDQDTVSQNLKIISLIRPDLGLPIGITGGEPTLLGDGIIRLIIELKKKLPRSPINILTNARLLADFNLTRKLSTTGHPDITFCIPLYSDNDSIHDKIVGAKGAFFETIKGLQNLALFRQKIEIRYVITALNATRMQQFSDFIYSNFPFVQHVAFMGMETTGLAKKNIEKVWIDPFDYMDELKKAVLFLHRRDVPVSIYNLQLCIIPTELWSFSRQSISDWKIEYSDNCVSCKLIDKCGGFFSTSGGVCSSYIKPIVT